MVGFDINQKRVGELVAGHDATLEVADASLSSVLVSSSPQIGQKGLFPSFDSIVAPRKNLTSVEFANYFRTYSMNL